MTTNPVDQIDKERIYQTITRLEGPRYPLDNMDALNAAADDIANTLQSYGLQVEMQEFQVEGMDDTFKNVVGYLGDRSAPATLLGSHYDTVANCPGANDNLSAVAISLEVARVLAQLDNPPPVIVAAFTLEEGHPWIAKQVRAYCLEHGIYDSQHRFTSVGMHEFKKQMDKLYVQHFQQGKKAAESLELIKQEMDAQLTDLQRGYIDMLIEVNTTLEAQSPFTSYRALVGSSHYVQQAVQNKTPIKQAIVYDTVGWIKNAPNTQKVLPIPPEMTKLHRVDLEQAIGNFVAILGDRNTKALFDTFSDYCADPSIDMPYLGLNLPVGYAEIAQNMPDLLRSDHAPFWEQGIPTLFMTDTANFRSELYHTPADTSATIDYETLAKLARATVKTLVAG